MRLDLNRDITDKELVRELRRLLEWTGEDGWRRKIAKLENRKPLSPLNLYGKYVAEMNPFSSALKTCLDLRRSGKSLRRHASLDIMKVATYAYVINRLTHRSNEQARKKVRGFLFDDTHVRAFLFELDIAIHFFRRGHNVDFMDLEGKAEYDLLVSDDPHELEVECKRKSADAGRKITRSAFYMLADILFSQLSKIGKRCLLKVECQGRMKSDQATFRTLAKKAELAVQQDKRLVEMDGLRLSIEYLPPSLRIKSDEEAVSILKPYMSSHAHFAIFSNRDTTVIVKSESTERDRILSAIYDELKQGATQFSRTRPALLACFIEDVDDPDWEQLREDSGLAAMTQRLFDNPERSHVQLAAYSSDRTPAIREGNVVQLSARVLHFENPSCTLRVSRAFLGFGPARGS